MSTFIREAVVYALVSACALMVDITVLWLLVKFLKWPPLTASTLSFLAGAVVAYELSVRLVFVHRRLFDKRMELAAFVAVGAVGLGVNACVIFVAVDLLGLHYLLGKFMAAGFTFTSNFTVRRQLLFSRGPLDLWDR